MHEFTLRHNSVIELHNNIKNTILQFIGSSNDLNFDFYFRGNTIKTKVFDEIQYKYKHHMAQPVKIDTSKMIISPMPGSIVSVSV